MQTRRDIPGWKRTLGIALFSLSFVFYGCLLLVPLVPFSGEGKVKLSAILVVLGEGSFWLSAIILGREMIEKYRKFDWRSLLSLRLKYQKVNKMITKKVDFMLPRVILHNAVSLDGRINGFPIDLNQYYELVSVWKEDATLAGSETFLSAASEAPPEDESALIPPRVDPDDRRALLVIPDSRGRIRTWHYLRSLPYWRHFVALCTKSTPQE
jgi:hypothetical protein